MSEQQPSFLQQHFPLLTTYDQDMKEFIERRRKNYRPVQITVAAIVVVLVVLVFYHSSEPDGQAGSGARQHDAAMACLKMQDSLGDFSANYSGQSTDNRWPASGLSSSATIELDELNTNHSYTHSGQVTTTIVIGRVKEKPESVAWIQEELKNLTSTAIYIVDDPEASLHLERNHGRESIVYLKYIIDHFDKLNDITFFFHPARYTWHNNMLLKEDSVATINRMSRAKVLKDGYVNSRCDAWPGCPTWVKYNPSQAEHAIDTHRQQDQFNHDLFKKLFPNRKWYPRYFGQPCCSQFAASREAIHNVGIETFQRLYDWIDGMRSDWNSGRMMEMMWQYVFLDRGTVCPAMEDCYCETYGICYGDDKDSVKLLESWNDHRSRTDELNEAIVFAEKKLKEKLAFLRIMAAKDPAQQNQLLVDEEEQFRQAAAVDPELIALHQDYEYVKAQSQVFKQEVMNQWGVEKSSEWW